MRNETTPTTTSTTNWNRATEADAEHLAGEQDVGAHVGEEDLDDSRGLLLDHAGEQPSPRTCSG